MKSKNLLRALCTILIIVFCGFTSFSLADTQEATPRLSDGSVLSDHEVVTPSIQSLFEDDPIVKIVKWTEEKLYCLANYYYGSNPWVYDAEQNQIINIGDSIFGYSKINEYLQQKMNTTFRVFATSMAMLDRGIDWTTNDMMLLPPSQQSLLRIDYPKNKYYGKPSVKRQYRIAVDENPHIETVIMNGGANDILLPGILWDEDTCKTRPDGTLGQDCKDFIDEMGIKFLKLWKKMGRDGVKHVIYLGYHYPKAGRIGCSDIAKGEWNAAVDYATKMTKEAIGKHNSSPQVHFIDMRGCITRDDIIPDGLHFSDSGAEKAAELIYQTLDKTREMEMGR